MFIYGGEQPWYMLPLGLEAIVPKITLAWVIIECSQILAEVIPTVSSGIYSHLT
jgi:hypothetical protein